ncbi:MAG: hypothetical protein E2O77_07405 [Caldithrix sp.]|nr:MAG: hypothetical protein E2O77_07405 [Caldithrix sp.]
MTNLGIGEKEKKIKNQTINHNRSNLHIPTIIAIAIVVWAISNAGHEIIGHGGVCVLQGYEPVRVSTSFFHCEASGSTFWELKARVAGGTVFNLALALLCLLLLRSRKVTNPRTNYFLWALMSVCLFYSASYVMGWFIGPTLDWALFLNGLEPLLLWKIGFIAVGLLILGVGFQLSRKYLEPFLGDQESERRRRMTSLTLIPYLTAIALKVSAGFMNPMPDKMLIFLGSFGATAFFLIWLNFVRFWPFAKQTASSQEAADLGLSIPWLVIGLVALILFVVILGPGIGQLPPQILD